MMRGIRKRADARSIEAVSTWVQLMGIGQGGQSRVRTAAHGIEVMLPWVGACVLSCLLLLSCIGCGNQAVAQPGGNAVVQDPAGAEAVHADVDLTALSSTMAYAEVTHIMENPEDYLGKSIRMRGPYYASYFEGTGLYYHYVLVEDTAACCVQGLEFVWDGDAADTVGYPDELEPVEVLGVFGSYEELGRTYYRLTANEVEMLE